MAADARLRALVDVSPIPANPEKRTGLARVALSLGQALAKRDDLELRTSGWGSLVATAEFAAVRREFPELHGLTPRQGLWQRHCTEQLQRSRPGWRGQLWHRAGQLTNLLRNPLAGISIADFDVVHSTYARFPRAVRASRVPTVLTLHDVMPLRLPAAMFSAGQVGITRRIVESIRPTDWIACVSDATRQDFLDLRNHPADRVVVIPNGVDHEVFFPNHDPCAVDDTRQRLGIGAEPFVLTLSSLAAHKNLRLLCEAWTANNHLASLGTLVIAGGRSTVTAELFAALGLPRQARKVIVTGHVSDADFRILASSCQAFFFPSLYEGFGLPVLEAMACGAPVVVSNATSLPEVVGSAGCLLSPHDQNAWQAAILEAIGRPIRTVPVQASLQRAADFSWDRTAAAYATLYKSAAA